MSYHKFNTVYGEQGSFEVFYASDLTNDDGEPLDVGYYWQASFPGCLPDGEPIGPFATEQEAINDAQDF